MTLTPASHPSTRPEYSLLADIDWDFPERVVHSGIEGIHPYPAKFVAELPRALLSVLTVPSGTAVLDLFCGSGTTLVESQRRGLPSVGVDLNPIACLITKVKTSPLPSGLKQVAKEAVSRARLTRHPAIPKIPRLNHWFNSDIQNALAAMSNEISTTPPAYHDALRLALSSIIVRVSNQESDTRYAAIDKGSTAEDVYKGFLRAAGHIHDTLRDRDYPLSLATVIEADTLELDPTRVGIGIGMIITSPPYPNAYEYWLYHKYRMYWLGFDPVSVKSREIGARAHFFKANHHTADEFVKQMAKTFGLIRHVLMRNGYVCFVIGRSRIHGRIVDNARIVEEVGRVAGFERVFSAERTLSSTRKSFNLSHANIKKETVLVLMRTAVQCV